MQHSRVVRRSTAAALVAVVALAILAVTPAAAIRYGQADGNAHPYVGLMVAQDEDLNYLWRCTGTLLSSRLFLTAGHCTESPAVHVEIWFDADVESGIPGNGYPADREVGATGDVGGTPHTHPGYDADDFSNRDLGVVVLDEPFASPNGLYGRLPAENQLDALKVRRGKQNQTFTAVGYGLQREFPEPAAGKNVELLIRMVAQPKLNQINSANTGNYSMLLSGNAHTGGTCTGDSGGPNFLGTSRVIAGVTSYSTNWTCGGAGGVYRLDRDWNLDWLEDDFGGLF